MLARPPALVAQALLPVRAVERAAVRHGGDWARAAGTGKSACATKSHIIRSLPKHSESAAGALASLQERRMLMDVVAIQKLLPHRYPFLMVDGILEVEPLKRIVGIKNVSINESYFQGHFPGKPVMPGVLIIEAMAQTGGLLCLLEIPDRDKKLLYFVAMDDARFRRPVVPGDQLRLEMDLVF